MSSARVLNLAQSALHTPNGVEKALRYLEEEARTSHEISIDARVWACIAHLRRKQGDLTGGDEAENTARQLADSGVPPRKLSFEENAKPKNRVKVEETGNGEEREKNALRVRHDSLRCRELLQEFGVVDGGILRRTERLMERTRRLRKISEGLLGDSVRGKCGTREK